MNQTLEIQDNEVLRTGFSIHRLIEQLNKLLRVHKLDRNHMWLLLFNNLLETLEGSTGKTYSFLQQELNTTQEMFN